MSVKGKAVWKECWADAQSMSFEVLTNDLNLKVFAVGSGCQNDRQDLGVLRIGF